MTAALATDVDTTGEPPVGSILEIGDTWWQRTSDTGYRELDGDDQPTGPLFTLVELAGPDEAYGSWRDYGVIQWGGAL